MVAVKRLHMALLAGTLALGAMAPLPALAQGAAQVGLMSRPDLWNHSGVLTPYGYLPPRLPSTWIVPYQVVHYEVPRALYVPVAVPMTPERPAVEPISMATVTLHSGAVPTDVQVRPGTVVTWVNGESKDHTLVLPQPGISGTGGEDTSRQWRVRANASFSLAFHQPGTYDYFRLGEPSRRGRIVVADGGRLPIRE